MNIKKQSRIETSKRAAELKPGDVFQAISDDTFQYVVISRDGKYVRFKELRTKQTFTNTHYEIEGFRGFKILGTYSPLWLRLITFGKVFYRKAR